VSAINAKIRASLIDHLETKLGDRADLIDKCIPKFPAMAKRLPKDNGWFEATGKSPSGITMAELEAQMQALKEA